MKCLICQTENKDGIKACRKCGVDMEATPPWHPSWQWHLKVLAAVYVVLIGAFFAINAFLKSLPEPYRTREIPKEITPWIK